MVNINHLDVSYSDGHAALKQISFQIKQGETVGIVGSNGAGKSTLLKTMVGILKPKSGSIEIDGQLLSKQNLRVVREKVGVVFQNPEDQLFMSNVYDDIAFGLRNMGMDEKTIEEKITHTLKSLGIERMTNQNSSKLSGGEQRLVAIATVMVMEPSLVLFDEPTSFLDPKTRRKLIKLLKEYTVTKLIATHDLDMALELCDRIIILKEGQVFEQGNAKDLLSNQELMERADLELPFCLQRS
ncbi:MAG: ABC transporter ATP-binding protein [Herbinix sp.]|nr:ABC transporter ATP-binding protein [Herbinix sp.]